MAELATRVWEGGAREHSAKLLDPKILADVDQSTTGGGVAVAPVIIVVCADTTVCHPSAIPASIWPGVQNLLLAATAEGLGSALTTMATLVPNLREVLAIPDDTEPYAVIPPGRPTRSLGPPSRHPQR